MDIEKVIQELNGRFALPLPEYYHRRIIFWHDEDREFEDKLDEIQLNHAKIVALTGSNTFMVKKLLSHDDLTSNYLVYNPLSFDRPDDDWLIDIKLYSEEFRADLISIWMDEMGLVSSLAMRKQVKHYRKFFNAKDRRARIVAQTKVPSNPAQLHLAVMAAICGLKEAQPNQIIQSVQFNFLQILTSISIDTNSFLESFARVLVLMPTSFANSVLLHSLSMSILKSLL